MSRQSVMPGSSRKLRVHNSFLLSAAAVCSMCHLPLGANLMGVMLAKKLQSVPL